MGKLQRRMKAIETTIINFLENEVSQKFEQNELAYLSLTSKIEAVLRDKIAFNLHRFYREGYIVAREWKRCDLAILDIKSKNPILLIEFKACYSFDLITEKVSNKYFNAIIKDYNKVENLKSSDTRVLNILFITCPQNIIEDEYKSIIKYNTGINKALRLHLKSNQIEEIGHQLLTEKFTNIYYSGFSGGKAFNVPVNINFCLINQNN